VGDANKHIDACLDVPVPAHRKRSRSSSSSSSSSIVMVVEDDASPEEDEDGFIHSNPAKRMSFGRPPASSMAAAAAAAAAVAAPEVRVPPPPAAEQVPAAAEVELELELHSRDEFNDAWKQAMECTDAEIRPHLMDNLRRLYHESIDTVEWRAMNALDVQARRERRKQQVSDEEFSVIRLELEHARDMLDSKQQDELAKIRVEEMELREKQVEEERKRVDAEIEIKRQEMAAGTLMLPGEKEALAGDVTVYFELLPTRGHDLSPASILYRTCESQFHRLSMVGSLCKIRRIEYVVNPRLTRLYQARRAQLPVEQQIPTLAFHGTHASNLSSICEHGFLDATHPNYRVAVANAYGAGIYFARDSSYSVNFAQGSCKMLMAYLLVTPNDTQPAGTQMIVMKESARCLPAFIVHFSNDGRSTEINERTAIRTSHTRITEEGDVGAAAAAAVGAQPIVFGGHAVKARSSRVSRVSRVSRKPKAAAAVVPAPAPLLPLPVPSPRYVFRTAPIDLNDDDDNNAHADDKVDYSQPLSAQELRDQLAAFAQFAPPPAAAAAAAGNRQ
jgi:hypothetical protein